MADAETIGKPQLAPGLMQLMRRNAYTRRPNPERRKRETNYKKGWEVRLVLKNEAEVDAAQRLVEESGLRAGKPFIKARQWVLPLYGRRMVELITASVDLRRKGR